MKVAYSLLVCFVIAIFALDHQLSEKWDSTIRKRIFTFEHQRTPHNAQSVDEVIAGVPIEILVTLLVLGGTIFIWDRLDRKKKEIQKSAGLK